MTATEPDVIDVLTADHREVEDLTDQITATVDPEERRDLTDQLIAELVRHSVAEEMYVYPAMRDHLPKRRASRRARHPGTQGTRDSDERTGRRRCEEHRVRARRRKTSGR